MNLTQLRAFVAVVDHGSFSEAARSLGVSQPAVTVQVQALETDVGATLFDRRYRRIELTEAGQALLPYARVVLEQLEQARDDIAGLSDTVSGRLVLAASTGPGQYVLPRLLGPFLERYPEVTVRMDVADTAGVVEAVESGAAQLGMTGAEVPGARVRYERLGGDSLVVIAPPGGELAKAEGQIPLAIVAERAFVMREAGSGTRSVTGEAFREAGVDPGDLAVVTELGTSEAIVSAVEGGMGLAVVSRLVADKALRLGDVVELDVAHFPVERPFFAVLPRGTMTRAADAFLDFLKERIPG